MKKKAPTPKRRLTDAEMMADPYQWPHLSLPIKRHDANGRLETAVLNGSGPTVYRINLWEINDTKMQGKTWDDLPKLAYKDYDAIVADGWKVD